MKKIIDLFAGCGGLSLGFQNAGFNILAAFENWNVAADCYERNFKHPVFRYDLSVVPIVVPIIGNLKPDIIIGGPPCQDFSHAGKRVESDRASLTEAFAQIVVEIRPKYFVMENVDRAQKSKAYANAREIIVKAGYGLTEVILDACYCGVPQRRKRFFCIGSLGQKDGFLLDYIDSKLSKKEMTLRDYFGDSLGFEYYYRHPRNYNRRAIFSIDEPAPTIRGVNRPVPQGYLGHKNDSCPLNNSIRAMTTLERALVQTFPADFKWNGNKTEMEQMIGNAVPVKLAEFVAQALKYHIELCERENDPDYSGFAKWLSYLDNYTVRTKRDVVSRLKRANKICEIPSTPDSYYLYLLEQSDKYKILTPAVRSQIKRAITLYSQYRNTDLSLDKDK